MPGLDRRRFTQLTSLAVLSAAAAPARAQQADIAETIQQLRGGASSLVSDAVQLGVPLVADVILGFTARDVFLRLEALRRLAQYGIEQLRETAGRRLDDLVEYGLTLLPAEDFIRPETPVTLPPAPEPEPWGVIIVDIVLETLGITLEKGLIGELLASDEEFRAIVDNAAGAVTTKDWKELAAILDNLLEWVVYGTPFRKFLVSKLGEAGARTALTRMAFSVGVRFVPLLGWAYMTGSLLLAIKNNYHRFQ